MKLSVRIPLLIGAVVLITSVCIGLVTLQISSNILETNILSGIDAKNDANAELLSATLNGQLDVLREIANRPNTRTMDWALMKPNLTTDIPRINALDMALVTPDGLAHYVLDDTSANLGDREYVQRAMAGEKAIGVVFSRVTSQIVVMFAVPIFQNDQSGAPVIGAVVARKDGAEALSDIVVNLKSSYPSGYSYMVDSDGTFIAHSNEDLVKTQFNPTTEVEKDSSLKPLADLITTALEEKNGFSRYTYNGKNLLGVYTQVPGYPWLLFSSIERKDVDSQLLHMRIVVLIIGIVFIVVGLAVAFFVGRSIAKPVISMAITMKDIAEGEGDLTRTVDIHSKDEIGDLALYFNKTLENIKDLVGTIKYKVNALTNTGYELSVNMNKTSKAVDNISANFETIKSIGAKQEKGSGEVNKALDNIKENIDLLKKIIEAQTESVTTSSSAIEEMTANIRSVSQTLAENNDNVEDLSKASELGRTAVQAVVQKIQEIAKDSEGLLEINSVMNHIASQTNLLSMNAAIEAAHAGESGKGFAVVAEEIRKLAESSSKQSKTTTAMLKKIKASIDDITKSSDEVLTRFGAIDTGIRTVAEHELNIRSAMEEQEVGGKQILDAVGRLRELTASVQKGSEDMSKSGSDLTRETGEFIKISNEAMSGMNRIVNGAMKDIKTAVTHVTETNTANDKNFNGLKGETTKFKTTTGAEKQAILVIDDDGKHLLMIRSFLEEEYDITTASSCEEALKLLYQGLAPDFILLDLLMPDVSGWDTYERIRGISDLHKVPIAIFTSSDDPGYMERAKEIGAVDYIQKPCKKSVLLDKIKQTIGK